MATLTGFGNFAALAEERITDKISRRVLAGQQAMIVWWSMKAGAHAAADRPVSGTGCIPFVYAAAHQHPHEQIVWMLKGEMELRIGGERRRMGPGDVAVIPGGVEHEVWFHEDTEAIDVFAPPREDFLAGGTPDYMKPT